MKLYYTRTWEAEINETDVTNECKPYFDIHFPSLTRKQKESRIDIITKHIIDKYTSYEFSELPMAFLKPLKAQVRQHLESFPIMVALMEEEM